MSKLPNPSPRNAAHPSELKYSKKTNHVFSLCAIDELLSKPPTPARDLSLKIITIGTNSIIVDKNFFLEKINTDNESKAIPPIDFVKNTKQASKTK